MEAITKVNWKADKAHSEIGFRVKHMMVSTVSGRFEDFEVNVEAGENFTDAKIEFRADVASINTRNQFRDSNLISEEFFDAKKFPEIRFHSISFDGAQLFGELTIKGVSKEVLLNVDFHGTAKDNYGKTKAGFSIHGELSRKEFDLTWNAVTETGSVVVADRVLLAVDLSLIMQ